MTLAMSEATLPIFEQMLGALIKIIDKAEAYCAAKKIDPAVLLQSRLYPDMLPLSRQIQLSGDFAKNPMSRLAGREPPKWEDTETTFAEMKARLEKTLAYVRSIPASEIDVARDREINFMVAGNPMSFKGRDYLVNFALPNFYFHVTTAYAILRHNGLDVGKRDFMGRA